MEAFSAWLWEETEVGQLLPKPSSPNPGITLQF